MKKPRLFVVDLFILLFLMASVHAQNLPSIRFCPTGRQHQRHVQLAESFVSPDLCVATFTSGKALAFSFTTNGGFTWSDACPDTLMPDPAFSPNARPAIGPGGIFLLGLIATQPPFSSPQYVAIASSNFGATWSPSSSITTSSDATSHAIMIDDVQSSPYLGRWYAAWTQYTGGSAPATIRLRRSVNSGSTWIPAQQINAAGATTFSEGPDLATGPDGHAYICWVEESRTSPYAAQSLGFARSTDGGETWTSTNNAYACSGIRGTLSSKGDIRVTDSPKMAVDRTGGPRNGWIYVVTPEKNLSPAGTDPDIILHRSTDNGVSWSAGMRVNQDALNNGKIQFCPTIAVDGGGTIYVLYYDDRNTTADSSHVYLSCSSDGGTTWTDVMASDRRYKPGAISNTSFEAIDVSATSDFVIVCWTDNSTGMYQAWHRRIAKNTITSVSGRALPNEIVLHLNYPNPFNPSTNIRFTIMSSQFTILKVFDLLGREVATLVNEVKEPGEHQVQFNAKGLSSGIYFYQLSVNGHKKTRRLLVVR